MSEVSTHTDLVLLGQVFSRDPYGIDDPILTMAVIAHAGMDERGPYDSPLGDAQSTFCAEDIFANNIPEILDIMNEALRVHHTMPVLVRYQCAPDGTGITILGIRPVTTQTLKQIVDFAWAKEG